MGAGSEFGKPARLMGNAKNFDGTTMGEGAEDDAVSLNSTKDGRLYVETSHPFFNQTLASYTTSTTASSLIAAPTAGLSLYINQIYAYSDTTCTFTFGQDAASLTTKFLVRIPAGGADKEIRFNPPLKLSAAKALAVSTSATITSIFVSAYTAS